MDTDNRHLLTQRAWCRSRGSLSATIYGRDRATKHEQQSKAKNDFGDDLCFNMSYFDVFEFNFSLQC